MKGEALSEVDAWCVRRADRISEQANKHILSGKSLNDPGYRMILGEHRAYMAMRSFIHGSLKAHP